VVIGKVLVDGVELLISIFNLLISLSNSWGLAVVVGCKFFALEVAAWFKGSPRTWGSNTI
jgi:hypothetical protein